MKRVASTSDPRDPNVTFTDELFWVAYRSRGNGGGQPEDVQRRWKDIQGEERHALMPIYDAYMKGYTAPVNGTLLTDWVDSPLTEPLFRAGIRTVEDLANSPNDVVGSAGIGCLALQSRAKEWVAKSETTKGVSADLAAANEQIKVLKEQMEKLLAGGANVSDAERAALASKPKRKYNRRNQPGETPAAAA